jgi:hypothetical protein
VLVDHPPGSTVVAVLVNRPLQALQGRVIALPPPDLCALSPIY